MENSWNTIPEFSWKPWTVCLLLLGLSRLAVHQGCPQAIAHSNCAIYSNKMRYLLFQNYFQNYCRISHLSVKCAIYLQKSVSCAVYRKIAIYFEISGHPCVHT